MAQSEILGLVESKSVFLDAKTSSVAKIPSYLPGLLIQGAQWIQAPGYITWASLSRSPVYRDVPVNAACGNYLPIDPVLLPEHTTTKTDEWSGLTQARSTFQKTWEERITFLERLGLMGVGWDGYSAKSPNAPSVTLALETMRYLSSRNVLPPKLLVDEDGDVVLTWGKARGGVMIFLTLAPPEAYLQVMDGDRTTLSTEFDFSNGLSQQSSIADTIRQFYPDAS